MPLSDWWLARKTTRVLKNKFIAAFKKSDPAGIDTPLDSKENAS